MSDLGWMGLALAVVAGWLLFKTVKFVFKIVFVAVVLFGLYWFVSPLMGYPRPF